MPLSISVFAALVVFVLLCLLFLLMFLMYFSFMFYGVFVLNLCFCVIFELNDNLDAFYDFCVQSYIFMLSYLCVLMFYLFNDNKMGRSS